MPTRHQPKKVGPRGDPVNRAVLYEFALLAKALGFMTPTIRKLLDPTQHPDRAAVRQMLENARKGYSYPDMERSISACLAQMNNDDDPRIPLYGENVTRLENDTMTLGTDGRPDNVQQRDSRDIALEEEELRLQAQKEVLEEEVSRLRSEKDQLQHDKSKLKSRMKDLHAEAKAAVDRNEELDEAENGLREMAKCLNEEIADLIRKRDGLIELLHALEQRYREQGSIPVQDFRAVDLEQQDQPEMVDAGLPIFEVGLTSDDDDELGPAGAMAGLDTDMDASYTGYGSSQESQAERDEGGHDTDMNESCTGHGTGTENNTIHFVKFDLVTKELQPSREAKTKEDTKRIAADLQAENNRLYVYRSAGPLEIAGEVGEANCYEAAIKRRDRTILVVLDAQGVPEPRRKVGRQGQRDGSSRKARLDRSEVYKKRPIAGTKDGYRRRYKKRREGPNGPLRTTDKRERRGERRRRENPQPLRPEPEPLRPEPLRPEPLRPEPLRPEPLRPEPMRLQLPPPAPLRPEPRPEPRQPEEQPLQPPPLQPPPPEPSQSTTENDEQKRQDPSGHESQSSDDDLRSGLLQ
ncbi:hypothetical protein Purlil1_14264 [Purpureocillium lilacinum]|uniref:Uncharacterized protein n=1 Tax=Purpureocillium lilacinum TaxID=33203 RepID=A0ABR0BBW3_PURLI|nr:hypothetical protein Purlil1_14264 [Purpureocillium lilacinum]